jgi:hypothetical protein
MGFNEMSQEVVVAKATGLSIEMGEMFAEREIPLQICFMATMSLINSIFIQTEDDELVEEALVHLRREYKRVMQKRRAKP